MAKKKQKINKNVQREIASKRSKRKDLIIISVAAAIPIVLFILLVAPKVIASTGINVSEIYTDGYQTVTFLKNGKFTAELNHGIYYSGKYTKTRQDESTSITYTYKGITINGVIANNNLYIPSEWFDGHVHNSILPKK